MHSPADSHDRDTVALMLESEGPGGAEVVVLHLAEELRRLGNTVVPVVLTRATEKGWLEAECERRAFAPERVGIRGALDWRCLRDIVRVLRRRHVTAVHSHEFGMAVYGTAASRWLGVPHVITMHGNMWMTEAWRRRAALRWAIRNSRATVAVSHDTRQHLLADLGIPESHLGTVWNGIPERQGDGSTLRASLGLAPDDVLLVAVGNLIERKGHAVLLKSLLEIHRLDPSLRWHVAIAGDGVERSNLQRLADEGGISERVHLLGHRSDVPDVLAASDIFVMSSHWEGLPLAVLEAMFAGKAVVASDVSGIPEAIPTPQEGRLVPPGDVPALRDALRPLLVDGDLRRRLGEAGRERARRHFSLAEMGAAYAALYRGAMR